jgi:hypothetical protein
MGDIYIINVNAASRKQIAKPEEPQNTDVCEAVKVF